MDRFKLFKKDPSITIGRKRTPVQSQSAWTCKICKTNLSKYTCPRCNLPYCSLECYKSEKHAECTESFFKDCVMENLKSQNASEDTKKKMTDTLKRMHEESLEENHDNPDQEEEPQKDLADRLYGLDLDTDEEKIWDRLTDEEKKEFEQFLASGNLSEVIQPWDPWWMTEIIHPKIVEIDASDIPTDRTDIPTILPAPDLTALFQRHPPSPFLPYSCLNLLYTYTLISRVYNGDHLSSCESASDNLLELSSALKTGPVPSSAGEAIITVTVAADGSSLRTLMDNRDLKANCMADVVSLLKDTVFTQAALSDMIAVLKKAWKRSQTTGKDLAGAFKKVEYFLAYVDEYPEKLAGLIPDIQIQRAEYEQATLEQAVVDAAGEKKAVKKTHLIEEM